MTDTADSTVLQFPARKIPRSRRNVVRADVRETPGIVMLGVERARLRPDPIVYVQMRRSVCIAHGIEFVS
ncbi:MAG: hypothetical protein EOP19_20665 [Hyphomicrobiales bacterium]|nr:MAG: hypothetical protein EOP19_20665 [Hyphomicrobiales bacterium]